MICGDSEGERFADAVMRVESHDTDPHHVKFLEVSWTFLVPEGRRTSS
jgi:hypothetical protein